MSSQPTTRQDLKQGWFMHTSSNPVPSSPAKTKPPSLHELPLTFWRTLAHELQAASEGRNSLRMMTVVDSNIRDLLLSMAWEILTTEEEEWYEYYTFEKTSSGKMLKAEGDVRPSLLAYTHTLRLFQEPSKSLFLFPKSAFPSLRTLMLHDTDFGEYYPIYIPPPLPKSNSSSSYLTRIDLCLTFEKWHVDALRWLRENIGTEALQHIFSARFIVDVVDSPWNTLLKQWRESLIGLSDLVITHAYRTDWHAPEKKDIPLKDIFFSGPPDAPGFTNLTTLTIEKTQDCYLDHSRFIWQSIGPKGWTFDKQTEETPFSNEGRDLATALAVAIPSLRKIRILESQVIDTELPGYYATETHEFVVFEVVRPEEDEEEVVDIAEHGMWVQAGVKIG